MIDLHCHMLPGIDDGARDLDMALRMAELAVADGITHTACTPPVSYTHLTLPTTIELCCCGGWGGG